MCDVGLLQYKFILLMHSRSVSILHMGTQRYFEYFYVLFHQIVNALSKQTCMIRIMQQDVKTPTDNPGDTLLLSTPVLMNVMFIWL